MINPNALPQSATVQDFQNFGDNLNSTDYNDTLNAMRYMQGQRTGGLNRLPQVTVPMQEGGMMEEAMMQEQGMPIQPMNPEEQAIMMQQVEQQEPREPNPEVQALAQQVASFGRGGDKLLLHIRPDEMQGLSSMLNVTINPTTGMPEVFLNKIFKAATSAPRAIAKGAKRIAKSKAFKTIAPIALAIAAPYALGALSPAVFGSVAAGGGTAFGGLLASGTVGGAFATAGLGSLAGNLLAGRKFGDAAKAALITGATAGLTRGIGNKMAGKTFFSGQTVDPITGQPVSSAVQASKDAAIESSIKGAPTSGYENLNVGDGVTQTGQSTSLLGDFNVANAQPNAVDIAIQQGNTMPTLEQTFSAKPGFIPDPKINQALIDGTKLASSPPEPTFLSRLGDAKDAVVSGVKDRYTFDKAGGLNLLKDVATADIGASAVEMDNAQQQALEDQQLADAGYSVAYPSGFGTQRVIRDSSGVVTNLTAADILSRALGGGRMQFAPQTTFAPTAVAAQGGLIELAQGGEFSGMVPGQGGGMDDNVYMPIKEGPEQVGTLAVSPSEYVVDSYTMAALGDGNPAEGARVMDKTIKQIRKKAYGNTQQPNEIDGLAALKPMAQGV